MPTQTIAVAGGRGGVGRTIVDALVASPLYDVVVLARKTPAASSHEGGHLPTAPTAVDDQAPVLGVDYSNVDETAALLASRGVVAVLSTIMVIDEAGAAAQVDLIKAAEKAGCVKRFVAAEWGILHPETSPLYPLREAAVTALRETRLEWTRFVNGYFMDYYGIPHVKSHMTPFSFSVDVANKAAAIAGTGNETLAFTYTGDLAKFVVAALGLEWWDEITYCYGERATFNDVVRIAEEARGTKFKVEYDSVEKLQKGEMTLLPSQTNLPEIFRKFFAIFGVWMVEGRLDVPTGNTLNDKFPEIQTKKLQDIVGAWKGH